MFAAIDRGEVFFLHQPQIDLRDGRLAGVEALIRWDHPVRGVLSPGAFLPGLESAAILDRITRFAIESAIRQVQQWLALGLRTPISVNLTPLILSTPEFPAWVAASIARAHLPKGLLKLEITE